MLKYCRDKFNKDTHLRLRSDGAGYQFKIMEYCLAQGIDFTITAELAASVRGAIAAIPEKNWRPMVKDGKTILFAETVYKPGVTNYLVNLPAFRLIVTRQSSCQLELFKNIFVDRAIISNFPEAYSAEEVLTYHNARGNAEKAIGNLRTASRLLIAVRGTVRERRLRADLRTGIQPCEPVQKGRAAGRLGILPHKESAVQIVMRRGAGG